ncbi:hypothetical protein BTE77_02400 [Ensifer adhaerens]|nr:hypothetical protein BTE77_02400 [Ensifer adhaerens]
MKILALKVVPPGSGSNIARFDAEIAPGIRAYGLKLVQSRSGLRVFGPSIAGGSAVTFAPEVANRLAEIAEREVARYECSHAA